MKAADQYNLMVRFYFIAEESLLFAFKFSGKWFGPRGISYWFVVIFRVNVDFRKTIVG